MYQSNKQVFSNPNNGNIYSHQLSILAKFCFPKRGRIRQVRLLSTDSNVAASIIMVLG